MTPAEDRAAIDELLTAYAYAIDTRDWDLLDQVFTADAALDYTSSGGRAGPFPEVRTWLAEVLDGFDVTQHFVTNRRIVVDGDQATARSYFFNPMGSKGKFFYVGGYYADRLERRPEGWRIVERIQETAFMDHHP